MFEQVDVGKSTKPWTVVVSATVQAMILGILILIPLIYTEALPKGFMNTFLVAPAPPPPPPPPAAPVKVVHAPPRIIPLNKMVAPTVIPKKVEVVHDAAPDMAGVEGGIGVPGGTGVPGGVLGGIIGGSALPPPPKPITPDRIRVGGNVEAGKLLQEITPTYPAIAKAAHVQGTVVLHAIIGKDGSIEQLQYVSGPAMLSQSCMSAVHQWRYRPYLLNGDPVEVDTTISCVFSVGD
jgi:periplasmic protein TonB